MSQDVPEQLDEQLTGNPDPDTHDGIDRWPFGDAADSSLVRDEP